MNDFLPEFENLPVIDFLKAARTHYYELHPDKNKQKEKTKRIKRPEDPIIIKQKKLRTRHYKEAMCAGSYEITGTEGICSYGGYTFKFIYEHCVDNRDVSKSMKNKTKDNYEVYYDLRRLAENKKTS